MAAGAGPFPRASGCLRGGTGLCPRVARSPRQNRISLGRAGPEIQSPALLLLHGRKQPWVNLILPRSQAARRGNLITFRSNQGNEAVTDGPRQDPALLEGAQVGARWQGWLLWPTRGRAGSQASASGEAPSGGTAPHVGQRLGWSRRGSEGGGREATARERARWPRASATDSDRPGCLLGHRPPAIPHPPSPHPRACREQGGFQAAEAPLSPRRLPGTCGHLRAGLSRCHRSRLALKRT